MGAESSKQVDWEARAEAVDKLRSSAGTERFFNRRQEVGELLTWLSREPRSVQVMVGPNDCGKTRLLERMQELWALDEGLSASSPIFYFDLRMLSWKTPEDAATQLLKAFQDWADRFRGWADRLRTLGRAVTFSIPGVEVRLESIMEAFLQGNELPRDLSFVLMRFGEVIQANPLALPIIILDEADRLKYWDDKNLDILSGCFKSLVKQSHRAFVILSSSDDFFRGWLQSIFRPGQWTPFGVGYFAEDEAKQFFSGHCIPTAGFNVPQSFGDADWQDVYQACGGSPLLLQLCADRAAVRKLEWKQSADSLAWDCVTYIEKGIDATLADEGFEGDKYRAIIAALKDKQFVGLHAILKDVFKKDRIQCRQQIKAMLHGNYIHVRYVTPSTYYGDIDQNLVGNEWELVMARSPADLAAMRLVLEEMEAP